jgi:predicted phosphodiesterase
MRLAVFSDIHGNLAALEAVLADVAAQGPVDHLWCLGDLAAMGPYPAQCIQLLAARPEVQVIEGNTDRYLRTGYRPPMSPPTEDKWGTYAQATRRRDEAFTWALEQFSWAEFDFLAKLKTELSLEVPGYGWLIGFHAAPGDDEKTLPPETEAHELRDALLDREGHLAFGGHTHKAMDRDLGEWRFINPGSVGLPFDGDPRAAYALVTFEGAQASVDLRRVDYDREGLIAAAQAMAFPRTEWLAERLRTGQG